MSASGGAVTIGALGAGTNIIGKVGIDQTTPGTTNAVQLAAALPAGSAIVGKVGIDQTTPGTTNGVQVNAALPAGANVIGKVSIDQTTPGTTNLIQVGGSLPAGSAVVGKVGIDQTTPGTTNAVQAIPATSGGLTIYSVISLASTNGVNVKGSAGQIYNIIATNINAAVRYLKLYNKATAPTVGTDTPVARYAIPGNAAGAGFVLDIPMGISFATGIGVGLTTGSADADTGAVAAGDIILNVLYK